MRRPSRFLGKDSNAPKHINLHNIHHPLLVQPLQAHIRPRRARVRKEEIETALLLQCAGAEGGDEVGGGGVGCDGGYLPGNV